MDKDIASIVFMPVCTKCLKIIFQTVDARQNIEIVSNLPRLLGASNELIPYKCPHCGARFDVIKIPTKLPFTANEYIT